MSHVLQALTIEFCAKMHITLSRTFIQTHSVTRLAHADICPAHADIGATHADILFHHFFKPPCVVPFQHPREGQVSKIQENPSRKLPVNAVNAVNAQNAPVNDAESHAISVRGEAKKNDLRLEDLAFAEARMVKLYLRTILGTETELYRSISKTKLKPNPDGKQK